MSIEAEKGHRPSVRAADSRAPEQMVFPFQARPPAKWGLPVGTGLRKAAWVSAWPRAVRAVPEQTSGPTQQEGDRTALPAHHCHLHVQMD